MNLIERKHHHRRTDEDESQIEKLLVLAGAVLGIYKRHHQN
jgi:hypothetical protein